MWNKNFDPPTYKKSRPPTSILTIRSMSITCSRARLVSVKAQYKCSVVLYCIKMTLIVDLNKGYRCPCSSNSRSVHGGLGVRVGGVGRGVLGVKTPHWVSGEKIFLRY